MIQLHNITKSFGTLQVLKGIDLHIGKGEVVSIVGPSGAGKTTLLQIMGTLDATSISVSSSSSTNSCPSLPHSKTSASRLSSLARTKSRPKCVPRNCSTTSTSATASTTNPPNSLEEKNSVWL